MKASLARVSTGLLAALLVAACVSTEPRESETVTSYEFATYDEHGNPTQRNALGRSVWGLGEGTALIGAAPSEAELGQDPSQDPEAEKRRREAMIRSTFGSEVIIGQDGRVTKRYSLGSEAGPVFLGLLTPFSTGLIPTEVKAGQGIGGQDLDTVLGRMLGPDHPVELVYLPKFEVIYNMPLAPADPKNPMLPPTMADTGLALLLVTAQPSALLAFEQALNLFFAHMPQVEIEVQVVEYSTNDSLSFGVETINDTTPILSTTGTSQLVREISSNFKLAAPLSGGSSIADVGLLTLGGIHDNFELNATLQMLETQGIADIKSNPKLVVRNGGLATIKTKTDLPYPKSSIVSNTNDLIATDILFKEVGITLHIRPEIAGTDTVILQIDASVSAVTGFAGTKPVATPIVATREAATSVHLKAGQTTVIGGLVSESTFENESKIPILGDIPILGYLFRSSTTQTTKTSLEFYVTPRILRGPQGFSAEGLGVR